MSDFLSKLLANPGAAVKSALTTLLAVAAVLAFAGQYVDVPADVVAWVAAATAVVRTLAVALNPKDPSYGLGA